MKGVGGMLEVIRRLETQERMRELSQRIEELSAKLAAKGLPADPGALAAACAEKLKLGRTVSRPEAAAFLGVCTKTLQRMQAAGELRRCPGLDGVVRYAASDVLRLASANGKEA